jgi:hypothetical protein
MNQSLQSLRDELREYIAQNTPGFTRDGDKFIRRGQQVQDMGWIVINGVKRAQPPRIFDILQTIEMLGDGAVITGDREEPFELVRFGIDISCDNQKQQNEITVNVFYDDMADVIEYFTEIFGR